MMKRLLTLAVALFVLVSHPAAQPAVGKKPKLVVILVIDQFRGDYPVRYAAFLDKGLKRLTTEGAWYRDAAAYPYANTLTCVGHTTIGTGTFPFHHGMIDNAWFDRESGRLVACTTDSKVTDVRVEAAEKPGIVEPTAAGDSAARMQMPTLAEKIRTELKGRVATVSLKARSAIGLAGHSADAVLWLDETGQWQTSSAYADTPLPFVSSFAKANPISDYAGKVWDRSLPLDKYQYSDEPPGEKPGGGWTAAFPHPLGAGGDRTFVSRFETSPFCDEYIEKMAEAEIDALELGQGDRTDFLGVSFSSVDYVGHAFGPRSHEIQDMVGRIDATIGRLLDHLDEKVGRDNYVVGLSADHGVADVPEQVEGGGRILVPTITATIEGTMKPVFGEGPFLAANLGSQVYFRPGVYDKVKGNKAVMGAIVKAVSALPGVARVLRAEEVDSGGARASKDPIVRAVAYGYYPGRSGDLIIVPKENWIAAISTTTHGSPYFYDQHVPVILFGAGIKPGVRPEAATPADMTVTLASIAGVKLGAQDGHVLSAALGPRKGSGF
jgi:predicted AlkP superfamily pyrophosphatase or phosphodiesterase